MSKIYLNYLRKQAFRPKKTAFGVCLFFAMPEQNVGGTLFRGHWADAKEDGGPAARGRAESRELFGLCSTQGIWCCGPGFGIFFNNFKGAPWYFGMHSHVPIQEKCLMKIITLRWILLEHIEYVCFIQKVLRLNLLRLPSPIYFQSRHTRDLTVRIYTDREPPCFCVRFIGNATIFRPPSANS